MSQAVLLLPPLQGLLQGAEWALRADFPTWDLRGLLGAAQLGGVATRGPDGWSLARDRPPQRVVNLLVALPNRMFHKLSL